MEGQTVKNNTRKSQRNSQIKVVTRWDYTEEPSPAFKRLISLLLQKGSEAKTEGRDDGHKL